MSQANRFTIHVLTLVIVGGVFLSAFAIYAALTIVHWIYAHPRVLVYSFMVLVVIQGYWLLHAYLNSRFRLGAGAG